MFFTVWLLASLPSCDGTLRLRRLTPINQFIELDNDGCDRGDLLLRRGGLEQCEAFVSRETQAAGTCRREGDLAQMSSDLERFAAERLARVIPGILQPLARGDTLLDLQLPNPELFAGHFNGDRSPPRARVGPVGCTGRGE